MDEKRWNDALRSLKARHAPTPAETERFVRSVMSRLGPEPRPWPARLAELLQPRWLVPALSVGLASVFFAIGRQAQSPELDLELLAGTPAAEVVLAPDASRALMAPEAP